MYNCECCNYSTEKKCNYNRHLNSKKHTKKINLCNKCPLCDYVSHRKENLKRHLKSGIHKELLTNLAFLQENEINDKIGNLKNENKKNENINENLKKILLEQENLKKMIPKSSGNTIINNKLSINVFLNTQCKDAMSIQDFLNQLQFSLDDLNYTKNNGYVEGISNMFVKELENLDPKERPIHCSDKKRLQFYVKTPNKWEKDDDNTNINKAIGNVQKKQIELMYLWDKQNPGWENNDKLIMERLQIAKSVYGSVSNIERNKENKQIKKIISEKIDLDINIITN
jgi:hypothetical protein